jgi:hypothetical protein
MVFGFNTEVVFEDVVYHVQSELRSAENLLQTQVFSEGHCIGKISAPIPAGSDEASAGQRLREQHRDVVQQARQGNVKAFLEAMNQPLAICWMEEGPVIADGRFHARLRITAAQAPVAGAELQIRVKQKASQIDLKSATDANGYAELSTEFATHSPERCGIVVEVQHGARRLTQRFRLQRNR